MEIWSRATVGGLLMTWATLVIGCGGSARSIDTTSTSGPSVENVAPGVKTEILLDASSVQLDALLAAGELDEIELPMLPQGYVQEEVTLFESGTINIDSCYSHNATFFVDRQRKIYVLIKPEVRAASTDVGSMDYIPNCVRWRFEVPEGYTFGGKLEPKS